MNGATERAEQIYQDGLALMGYRYYANALACFEQAIDLKPDFPQAWFQIGHCRSELAQRQIQNTDEYLYTDEKIERYQGGVEAYQKAIELQPDYTDARNSLAELFFYFGESQSEALEYPSDYMRAIKWYKQAAEIDNNRVAAYDQIGEIYNLLMENCSDYEIGDQINFVGTIGIAEEYIETYQQFIEAHPNDAEAYYELGKAYMRWIDLFITMEENYGDETSDEIQAMKQDKHPQIQGVLKKAIEAYRTAVRIKFDYRQAYYKLAEACQRIGLFKEAVQAYKQDIVLNAKNCSSTPHRNLAEAYHGLGQQNFANGNYVQAIECYHSAVMADSSYDAVYYDLAVANDEAGRYELAILWYERSAPSSIKIVNPNYESAIRWYTDIRRSYRYLDLYYRMGKTRHRLSRYQDAVEAYEKAIDLQIAIVDAYNEAWADVQMQSARFKEKSKRQGFLRCFTPEPPEYPEWWDDIVQNRKLAQRYEPLRDEKLEKQLKLLV